MEMNTPDEFWEHYKAFVFDDSLTEQQEFECRRAFFAGSEAVFKVIEHLSEVVDEEKVYQMLFRYRETNRDAAMETVPDEEEI